MLLFYQSYKQIINVTWVISLSTRVKLKKLPSIRETLKELGVTPAQVFSEIMPKYEEPSPTNGTAPTPLINYLDVN